MVKMFLVTFAGFSKLFFLIRWFKTMHVLDPKRSVHTTPSGALRIVKKKALSLNTQRERKNFLAQKSYCSLTFLSSQKNINCFLYFNPRVKLTFTHMGESHQKLFSRYVKKYFCIKKELFWKQEEKLSRRKLETTCKNEIWVTPKKETLLCLQAKTNCFKWQFKSILVYIIQAIYLINKKLSSKCLEGYCR